MSLHCNPRTPPGPGPHRASAAGAGGVQRGRVRVRWHGTRTWTTALQKCAAVPRRARVFKAHRLVRQVRVKYSGAEFECAGFEGMSIRDVVEAGEHNGDLVPKPYASNSGG